MQKLGHSHPLLVPTVDDLADCVFGEVISRKPGRRSREHAVRILGAAEAPESRVGADEHG